MAETNINQPQHHNPPPSAPKPKTKDKEEGTPVTDEVVAKEGDIEAGKYTPEELKEQAAPRQIPQRDRRAYLLDQARRNEAANDEVNAREVEVNNENRDATVLINDPDRDREENLKSSLADIKMHTKEGAEDRAASRQAIAEARAEEGNPSAVPGGKEHRDDPPAPKKTEPKK